MGFDRSGRAHAGPAFAWLIALGVSFAVVRADPFTVIGLPDTQKYAELYPDQFIAQAQWIAANIDAHDIRFVSHYGDVVQNGTTLANAYEWDNAEAAMSIIHASGVPYGVTIGNHDALPTGQFYENYDPSQFLARYGPDRYAGRDWFGGASPSGLSTYQIFKGGGREFVALHIEVETPWDELAWAQSVINEHHDKPVMVTTHRYLQDADDYVPDGLEGITSLAVESGRYPSVWYTIEDLYNDPSGISAEDFFQHFVHTNRNIFLVNAGHFHEEYRQTSSNYLGQPVHEVLADYQDDPNGGNGYLRIMRFDTAADTIEVDSYSPTLDHQHTKDESRFTLAVDFDRYSTHDTARFQQGIGRYTGTVDTWINEDSPNSSYGSASQLNVDDDTANSFFSDSPGQALIRFEDIFGNEAWQVRPDRQIGRATLVLAIADDIDIGNRNIDVWMAGRDWDESSTWNSLGDGMNGSDLALYLGSFNADNDPNGWEVRTLDVTAAVAAWLAGAPNFGFVLTTPSIDFNDDGLELFSSESGVALWRPALIVDFTPPLYTASVPEPTSGWLLAIVLVACGSRRKNC